jgi:hypothetical protein
VCRFFRYILPKKTNKPLSGFWLDLGWLKHEIEILFSQSIIHWTGLKKYWQRLTMPLTTETGKPFSMLRVRPGAH